MKTKKMIVAVLLCGLILTGCGTDGSVARRGQGITTPVRTLRPTFTPVPTATHTALPSVTPLATNTPLPPTETPPPPTVTPIPPTNTLEPPTPIPATDTPAPPTPTAVPPTATKRPPAPTKAPATPTPAPQARHVVGAHGISGLVVARDKTTFAVGEKAFFTYEALNHTSEAVGFELLGIKASNGLFNTSWINPDFVQPGVPFKHDDGLTFTTPGTYQVMLAICFSGCGETDADWEEFPHGAATITVK